MEQKYASSFDVNRKVWVAPTLHVYSIADLTNKGEGSCPDKDDLAKNCGEGD